MKRSGVLNLHAAEVEVRMFSPCPQTGKQLYILCKQCAAA
jgi:hypothetical protein